MITSYDVNEWHMKEDSNGDGEWLEAQEVLNTLGDRYRNTGNPECLAIAESFNIDMFYFWDGCD